MMGAGQDAGALPDNPGLTAAKTAPGLPDNRVIYLKERNVSMIKNDLILRNPLRAMGFDSEDILPQGALGSVLARAGVGKTAFLVQLAINALLRGKNVLHISLSDPVNKVTLWYEEVFGLLAKQYGVEQTDLLWESLLPHRFIMTFKAEGFNVETLEERMTDLMEQSIFLPQIVIIDGYPFDENSLAGLSDLKKLMDTQGMKAWLTVRTHRHQDPGPGKIPAPMDLVSALFEVIIQLQPEGKMIHVRALEAQGTTPDTSSLLLDPATMLIVEQASAVAQ